MRQRQKRLRFQFVGVEPQLFKESARLKMMQRLDFVVAALEHLEAAERVKASQHRQFIVADVDCVEARASGQRRRVPNAVERQTQHLEVAQLRQSFDVGDVL
jgi:hypothetical protein